MMIYYRLHTIPYATQFLTVAPFPPLFQSKLNRLNFNPFIDLINRIDAEMKQEAV
jgi:hypothetical protein